MRINQTDDMDVALWFEQRVGMPLLNLHDRIYKRTNGRIGHRVPGAPRACCCIPSGRRPANSAQRHSPTRRDGDNYLVVASKGCSWHPRAPGWYHNVKANPQVEINIGPKRLPVTAERVLPDNATYVRLGDRQPEQLEPLQELPDWDLPPDPRHRFDAETLETARQKQVAGQSLVGNTQSYASHRVGLT